MSAELWARDASGVNRKFRELWAQDGTGVNRKLKGLWANVDGVNRKIFSGAVTWTYSLDGGGQLGIDFGNSTTYSAFGKSGHSCTATYVFSAPITVKAGQTISLKAKSEIGANSAGVDLNNKSSEPIFTGQSGLHTYTAPNDIVVSNVECYASGFSIAVTIQSDSGSFLLNNSGTSDQ